MRYKQIMTENVGDDPQTNARINEVLKNHDPDTQARLHDALEGLKSAGPRGLEVNEWAKYVRSINGDEFSMKDLLTIAVKEFPFVVRRIGDKRYGWVSSAQTDDVPDDIMGPVAAQVGLAYDIRAFMQRKGQFTEDELTAEVRHRTHMAEPPARQLAMHMLAQFAGLVQRTGPGRWVYVPEKTQSTADHMAAFKDMVRKKPGPG